MNFINGLYKSEEDNRDFLVRSFVKEYEGVPAKFDVTDKMTPVRNQGNEGSCAGFAGTGVKEYQEQIDQKKFIELSPRFIYEKAKKISGHLEGTTLKAIVEVLTKMGICKEVEWPYVAGQVGKPNDFAYKNALEYKISAYARVTNLDELKMAIHQLYPSGGAVLIGMQLYKGAIGEQAQANGITPDPSCWDTISGPIGGHALVACGWNDFSPYYKNDGHIKCKGSWGTSFGAKGYHFFSYRNVKANLLDAMAMVDISTGRYIMRVASLSDKEKRNVWV